jgi:hypothetical protein
MLWDNASITFLPADKDNAKDIFKTLDYKQVIALLDDPPYKHPMQSIQLKN